MKKPEQATKSNDDIILDLKAEALRLEAAISSGIEEGEDVMESINRMESIRRELGYRQELAEKMRKAAARKGRIETLRERVAALEGGAQAADAVATELRDLVAAMSGHLEEALKLQQRATARLKDLKLEYERETWIQHLTNNVANFTRYYTYWQKRPGEFMDRVEGLIEQIEDGMPAALEQAKRELADYLEGKPA